MCRGVLQCRTIAPECIGPQQENRWRLRRASAARCLDVRIPSQKVRTIM